MSTIPETPRSGSRLFGQTADVRHRHDGRAPGWRNLARRFVITSDEQSLTRVARASGMFLALLMAIPLVTGRVSVYNDLSALHLPIRDFYARCLAEGDNFDWMPQQHGGFFLTGEGETGCYHPWHYLLYRWLPLDTAFALESACNFAVMLAGMYVFLRRKTGPAAAWLAGIIYTFSTNNLHHAQHINFLEVMAHLPWLLWLMDLAASAPKPSTRLRACAGIGFLTGSQFLSGHPQAMSYSLLAEALYAAFLVGTTTYRWRACGLIGTAKLIGVLIGSVQLLATYSFLGETNRSQFDPFLGSFPPSRLIQVVAPYLLSAHVPDWNSESAYFGCVAVVLVLFWLGSCCARMSGSGGGACFGTASNDQAAGLSAVWIGAFAVGLGILAAWLATGSYGGLYRFQTMLPLVGQFRAPARYVNLVGFAAALMAALGFARLVQAADAEYRIPWRFLVLPWIGLLLTAAVSFAFWRNFPDADTSTIQRSFLTAPLIMAIATLALTMSGRGHPRALFILPILAAADLGLFSLCNKEFGRPIWLRTTTLSDWIESTKVPPDLNAGRMLSHIFSPQQVLHRGGRLINGYGGGLEPLKHLDYLHLNTLRVAEVAWFQPGFDGVPIEGLVISESGWPQVPHPLPRARLVTRVQVSHAPREELKTIDVDRVALVVNSIKLPSSRPGIAAILEDRPGRIRLSTRAPSRQMLVVSESYSRGWQATLDGTTVPVERVNGDFLGCVVDAGEHQIEFAFRPTALGWGRMLSVLGASLATVLGLVTFRRGSWLSAPGTRN